MFCTIHFQFVTYLPKLDDLNDSNLDDLNMLVSHPKEDVLPVYNPNLDDSQCVIQTFLKMLESLSKLNYIQRTNTHSNTIILSLKTIVQSL